MNESASAIGRKVNVTAVDIVSFLKNLQIREMDEVVIKMDVEGHEAAVLRGAVKTLKAHQPFLVFESWAGDRSSPNLAPLEELAALGYRFFQPTFLKGEEASAYLSGYGNNHGMSGPARLGLWEFSPAERPLLHEQFNIFACPDGRMDDLQERFLKHIPLNLAE